MGVFPEWKRVMLDKIVLACKGCGGDVKPAAEAPLWKRSQEAWASWKAQDGGAEWIKFAPYGVKLKLGLVKPRD